MKGELNVLESNSRKTLEEAIEVADLKISTIREDCDQKISVLQTKWEITEMNLVKMNQQKDADKRRLTRQVYP